MNIEEEITKATLEKYEELNAMSRAKLNAAFMDAFREELHPRIVKTFPVKALTFRFQGNMWIQRTGSIPDKVRRVIVEFWNTNGIAFICKEGMKDEKSVEMAKARTEKTRTVKRTEKSPMGVQASIITLVDKKASVSPVYETITSILAYHGGTMAFHDLEKHLKKAAKDINLSAALVILGAKKVVEIKVESNVVDDVVVDVTEESLPDAASIVRDICKKDRRSKTAVMGDPNYNTSDKTARQVVSA